MYCHAWTPEKAVERVRVGAISLWLYHDIILHDPRFQLAVSRSNRLVHLGLNDFALYEKDVQALAHVLESSSSIVEFTVLNTWFSQESVGVLARALLGSTKLKDFDSGGNSLGNDEERVLYTAFYGRSVLALHAAHPHSPLHKFLARDGDHAVMFRVLAWLVGPHPE